MAKRATGVGKLRTSRSKKTTKRLAVKKEMLAKKASKTCQKPILIAQKQVKRQKYHLME